MKQEKLNTSTNITFNWLLAEIKTLHDNACLHKYMLIELTPSRQCDVFLR